ncbi:sulfotransferase [Paracoccus sp. (in: a-proteobacteria)]|uniref:sulfotransferase family protein n=1 Tax=Paracoccus sp. TaxID=267 RepID=UPI0035B45589
MTLPFALQDAAPVAADRPAISGAVDFVIVGAMRAGTTTLHALLADHPQISMSRDKETDFFIAEKNYSRGLEWYQAQFDPARPLRGEASPNYAKRLDFPGVPARLARHAPRARLIYVVRDPIARAQSQYAHAWNMGDMKVLPQDLMRSDEYDSLVDVSSYARQLQEWRAHFPEESILIVDFDQLIAAPQEQLARILGHIGAAPMQVAELASHNDMAQLSRVPRPLMRLAHGRLRPLLTAILGQRARSRLRQLLAIAPRRSAPEFPASLCAQLGRDLAQDCARFRQMTGMEFRRWPI